MPWQVQFLMNLIQKELQRLIGQLVKELFETRDCSDSYSHRSASGKAGQQGGTIGMKDTVKVGMTELSAWWQVCVLKAEAAGH